jgi:hypothetical protein
MHGWTTFWMSASWVYDALRRVFDGADASQLFAEIAKTCVTG